jgi:predicted aspartyl protease
MSEPYTRRVQPPGPALSIRLQVVAGAQSTAAILALVDTGSDATIVPLHYLLEIGAEETAPGWLISFSGERMPVAFYFVDVRLGELVLPGVRVAGSPQLQEVLLGRDVLNKLVVLLDGPQFEVSILDQTIIQRLRGKH